MKVINQTNRNGIKDFGRQESRDHWYKLVVHQLRSNKHGDITNKCGMISNTSKYAIDQTLE